MSILVQGLHHVTLICRDAAEYDRALTALPEYSRVKKTVNFDTADTYHLYFGIGTGRPGSIITYFERPDAPPRVAGSGEVSVIGVNLDGREGDIIMPDGDHFEAVSNVEVPTGLAGVTLELADIEPTVQLLENMGYSTTESDDTEVKMHHFDCNGAGDITLRKSHENPAREGAGSVHHVAFAVEDLAALEAARARLLSMGIAVTGVRDRTYFKSIYFREPGGVLFEFATNGPGFPVDEDRATLGTSLRLPPQHEHLREKLIKSLQPLD
jgi:glyoxalase family protein